MSVRGARVPTGTTRRQYAALPRMSYARSTVGNREMQRTPTIPVRFVRIGTVGQEPFQRHYVALERGELQRCELQAGTRLQHCRHHTFVGAVPERGVQGVRPSLLSAKASAPRSSSTSMTRPFPL